MGRWSWPDAYRPWEVERGTTTAVRVLNVKNGDIQTWIATNTPELPRSLEGKLIPGEVFIEAEGHAERTIVNALGDEWIILHGGTSRGICWRLCMPMLNDQGLLVGGPDFVNTKPWNSPYRMFWRP